MRVKVINSFSELKDVLSAHDKVYLLLYKSASEASDCARKNLENAVDKQDNQMVLMADVKQVQDIHEKYGITSVPVFLTFEKQELKNIAKGCNTEGFYHNIFNQNYSGRTQESGEKAHQVIVYSTPGCSWCNTLKAYLRQQKISFREIDVSRDENAAREMVRRSGQQGVPQTLIDGQLVVGFDKSKINRLLGINVE
ncbi:MAG TPA: glutaredoxin domain-containing protein [Bacteroidia bacterium]|nr:glutaredoxin domain-containing protein [Bacteroidia bacterium]HRS57968.1 glutaredoxin domain-containing protein [Bacteroidia bacterium]HRU68011.1 glutaredoxin domain-containing protein [Bacteroidia bacterium]